MKLSSIVKAAVFFGMGFFAGAIYVGRVAHDEYEQLLAYKEAEIRADCEMSLEERDQKREEEYQNRVTQAGIDYAMSTMNLQREDGSSIYDTTTHTYEIIPPDKYGVEDVFEPVSLTIFADGVLAYDLNGFLVEDPDRVIGPHTLDHMGQFEPDEIHVRNHLYRKDYEILRSEETYEEFYGHKPGEEDD